MESTQTPSLEDQLSPPPVPGTPAASPPPPKADSRVAPAPDDKAAALERLEAKFSKERFVYIYIIIVLFDSLVGSLGSFTIFFFVVAASLILLIALAKWLEFRWVVTDLERWHGRLSKWLDKKFGTAERDKIEPL